MKARTQLNKRIQELELQLHTKKYIHIPMPSWEGIRNFSLMIICAFLSYFNFLLIKSIWTLNNLGYVFATIEEMINCTPEFIDLIILYPIVGEFILISLTIIFVISLFKKLKPYNKGGLIWGLIVGLIFGLAFGLICGLILALIGSLIVGLTLGLTFGLIVGLVVEFD